MAVIVYTHDGESVYDLFFLNHLLRDNYVYFLTFNEKPNLVPSGVHVIRMREPLHPKISPAKGLNVYLNWFLRSSILRECLDRSKPDLVIGCGAISYGFYSALSNYSPNVLLVWGSDVLVAPKLLPFRFMAKYSLKKADAVVVDSQIQEKACINLGCDPKKIVRFPWVDLRPILNRIKENTSHQRRVKKAFKEKHGWRETDPIIISTRHHEPIYNMECLIEAIPLVVKEVRNARFLILGSGSQTEKLKKSVEALGIKSNVRFIGRVPAHEIPIYLKMVNIYVSTSLSDGTSASLVEAMTCTLPVIVTDIPGNREWIVDGKNGLLFPAKDSETLAEIIVRLLRDRDFRKSLGVKAHETVMGKADWQSNSKLLDNLISSMVDLK